VLPRVYFLINKFMRYKDLIEENTYTYEELTTFVLSESSGNWTVVQSSAYRKGLKKHQNDKRVMLSLQELLTFIQSNDSPPPVKAYPHQFNVHTIRFGTNYDMPLWSHLKGQTIGLLFDVEPGVVKLYGIGTHKEVGVSKT